MTSNQSWTVGTKLWLLSGALVANALLAGGISYWNAHRLGDSLLALSSYSLPAVRDMGLLDMMHDGVRANAYSAVIHAGDKDTAVIQNVRTEASEFADQSRELLAHMQTLPLAPDLKAKVTAVTPKFEEYLGSARSIVDTAAAGKVEQAMAQLPGLEARFEALEGELEKIGEAIESDATKSGSDAALLAERSNQLSAGVLLFGALFGLGAAGLVIRKLQTSLKDIITGLGAESTVVAQTSSDLGAAAQNLASATTQQAAALQETAASVDEIAAMVKKTSDNSRQLESTTQRSQQAASKGQAAIAQMHSAMETLAASQAKIMSQVEDGNRKISDIIKVIGEIGSKTKVINDIVFQTKLLSFNASVEAARAGEHGKGFAVVAEEVGNLAQMSGNAAKEISEMLSSSIERVEGIVVDSKRRVETLVTEGREKLTLGTNVARQCGDALDEIVKLSHDVGSMVSEITTAIYEQNQGVQEISKAIQLLDQATHQNSVTSKETSHTATALRAQSGKLSAIVGNVQSLVLGTTTQTTATAPATSGPTPQEVAPARQTANSPLTEGRVLPLERRPKSSAHSRPASPMTGQMAAGGESLPSADDPRFEDV